MMELYLLKRMDKEKWLKFTKILMNYNPVRLCVHSECVNKPTLGFVRTSHAAWSLHKKQLAP